MYGSAQNPEPLKQSSHSPCCVNQLVLAMVGSVASVQKQVAKLLVGPTLPIPFKRHPTVASVESAEVLCDICECTTVLTV